MKQIWSYIKEYFYESNKWLLLTSSILIAILIFLNYHFVIDDRLSDLSFIQRFAGRYLIYSISFWIPYWIYSLITRKGIFRDRRFLFLLLVSPAIFSLKAGWLTDFNFTESIAENDFWNHVAHWPLMLMWVLLTVFICWQLFHSKQLFYGTKTKDITWKPYWLMLVFMVPLIAAASTQTDFLATYPKLKMLYDQYDPNELSWLQKLIFELSYGSDFISIELFFRGFLVLAFVEWAGKEAIVPMACFYCTIHFGKPLGECISSFFGGLLLGIVVYNTRSIWGGLMVHLGIAWLMELGGHIGNAIQGNN